MTYAAICAVTYAAICGFGEEVMPTEKTTDAEAPVTDPAKPIRVRAIDVTPYDYGIWCSIDGAAPFLNEVVGRRWHSSGGRLWLMLESHNFVLAYPDEQLEVVPLPRSPHETPELRERIRARDAEEMRASPLAHEVTDVY